MNRRLPLAAVILIPFLGAQSASTVWDGIYSTAQAASGESLYAKNCASCHGAALEGKGQAPPLVGSEFLMNWNGATVGELFEKMQTSMPADKPGALVQSDTASILAFMLAKGRFPAGSSSLPANTSVLGKIRFEAAKTK